MAKKLTLAATIKALTPFLAADKKPEEVAAAIQAAADAMPESQTSEAVKDKRARDRKARDEKRAEDRKARDEAQKEKDKAEDEKIAKDRGARDAAFEKACDEADPEKTNDAEVMKASDADMEAEAKDEEQPPAETGTPSKGGKSEPGTMDSGKVQAAIDAAVKTEREAGKALRIALDKVAPVLGKVTFDSAPEAYKAALTKLAVSHTGVADAALPALFDAATRVQPAPKPAGQTHDSANDAAVAKLIPNLNRLP